MFGTPNYTVDVLNAMASVMQYPDATLTGLGCGGTRNDNHNISNSFGTAMQRSVQFFDQHVKGTIGE